MLKKKQKAALTAEQLPPEALPAHVAIIMDGNGRWAKKRGLPRTAGHAVGAKVFRTIAKHAEKRGIRVLTVYAFSTENWRRPPEEVAAIMDLIRDQLKEYLAVFKDENICARFIGDRTPLAPDILELMEESEFNTSRKTGMQLNIALNYGGRHELVEAVRAMAAEGLPPEALDEAAISARLYTGGQPDPDLIIRPGGEHRLSNFLIWQAAYAEFVFMDNILWPDFSTDDFDEALVEFARRSRRFGGI